MSAPGPGRPPAVPPQDTTSWLQRVWREQAPVAGALLAPAELLFRLAQAAYHAAYDAGLLPTARAALPTISIGNLAVGGAGKTPVARWLLDELLARGERPALLHGGYAADEPELHRRWHPQAAVYAGRDRARSAALAAAEGASVLVLDDGFQHRRLRRDLDIVLVAAERWSARPRLLPRGPWREPTAALRRAQAVVVTRKVASPEAAAAVAEEVTRRWPHAVVARLALLPAGWHPWTAAAHGLAPEAAGRAREAGGPAAATSPTGVAVCAIAEPAPFLENARAAGGRFAEALVFRDHHAFSAADVARIERARAGGVVLTTEKDAVRLAAAAPGLPLAVLEQAVHPEGGVAALLALVERVLRRE